MLTIAAYCELCNPLAVLSLCAVPEGVHAQHRYGESGSAPTHLS